MAEAPRRFPTPWHADPMPGGYVVRDANGQALFDVPGTGSAETGAAPAWQLIQHFVPGIGSVVVRRPLDDIIASFARSEVAHIASIECSGDNFPR